MDNNTAAFLALLKAGLWEQDVNLLSYEGIDYNKIYKLAEDQTVVGIVTAGLEHVSDCKVPQEDSFSFIGSTMLIEQRNIAMNNFISKLIGDFQKRGICTLLLKGQGIAQCYERPLWRTPGDIDLLLSNKDALEYIKSLATKVEDENLYTQHLAMIIDSWVVELHGTLRCNLWKRIDKVLDEVQDDIFFQGNVRSWMNGNTLVFLPGCDEDAIYVFSHFLEHFFKGGIGLRQICDWCRLLSSNKNDLDWVELEYKVRNMGVMSEWRSFAALAVDYLGMPKNEMPLYSSSPRWSRKAKRILSFILETGNFGQNRDASYHHKYPYVIKKTISLWQHLCDSYSYFFIFPYDSLKVLKKKMTVGIRYALKGK